MPDLKAKLKPKTNETNDANALTFQMNPPVIKVGAPQVKVDVPAPKITMDTKQLAETLNGLTQMMAQIAAQQNQLLSLMTQEIDALKMIAVQQPNIRVDAPTVKMPARPKRFYVSLDKEGNNTVGMMIEAESPH